MVKDPGLSLVNLLLDEVFQFSEERILPLGRCQAASGNQFRTSRLDY